jgi:hypothetical protein
MVRVIRSAVRFVLAPMVALSVAANASRADDMKLVTTRDGTTELGGWPIDLSSDGRHVLFKSSSSMYVDDDTNGQEDLFVNDLDSGTIERVNLADDESESWVGFQLYGLDGSISPDGRFVAFATEATLDAADNSGQDIYLRDRAEGTTVLVSHSPAKLGNFRHSFYPRVTPDGSFVVFTSSVKNLVDGDDNGGWDVFEWERATGAIKMVSTDSAGVQLRQSYLAPACVSADGNIVAFPIWTSVGRRLINTVVKDLVTGALEQIDGNETGDAFAKQSWPISMTSDGRFVLFDTADALVASDQNLRRDGYVRDRQLSTIERVTLGAGSRELANDQYPVGMSEDARRIAFNSIADASGDDTNGIVDGFVHDRDSGASLRVTLGLDEREMHIGANVKMLSADGLSALNWSMNQVLLRQLSDVAATWTVYGTGFDGRFGTPTIALDAPPCRSTRVALQVGNSSGLYAASVVLVGFASTSLPTSLGGTLLVDPFTNLFLPLTPLGGELSMTIPTDGDLPGLHLYLQALELDPWAMKGVSFTPGLDLTIGD